MDDRFAALDDAHQTPTDPAGCPYCACLLAAYPAEGASPEAEQWWEDGDNFARWLRLCMVLVAGVSVVLTLSGAWAG
ncbi:hypothetical protein ACQF36_28155 [Streptomyces sp. Marseille-Q5077]|uniref:hypothetical protein n=1 Tax=Streptomyces sp. Marseille-Q5077 TaxID=3418995 RepID=UPI003D074DC3